MNKIKVILSLVPLVLMFLFFWVPIIVWLQKWVFATNTISFWPDSSTRTLLLNTFYVASITSLVSTTIAHPITIFWWLASRRYRTILISVMMLPLFVGLLARNYSWIGMLSYLESTNISLLNIFSDQHILYTNFSVVLVMIYIFIPFAFFIIIQSFSTIGFAELNAGKTMGASFFESLHKLVLPRTWKQTIISILFIFASSFGYYVTPRMIGGGKNDLIGNLIWRYMEQGDLDSASLSALILLLLLVPLYVVSFILIVRWRRRILGR